MDDWEKEFLESANEFEKQQAEEEKREQFREWGRLGGRPKKSEKRNEKVTVRYTPLEKMKVKNDAEKVELSLAEFIRRTSLNISLPNAEKNKTLVEYRTNFKRLANVFRSNIWTPDEKKKFTDILTQTVKGIERELQK